MKKSPRPADRFVSNYYVEVDPELCSGCGYCVPRCQMDARTIVDGKAVIDLDRCIGCGNCVANCKQYASLLRKKEYQHIPPKNINAMFMKILSFREGKWKAFKVRAKMMLGLRV